MDHQKTIEKNISLVSSLLDSVVKSERKEQIKKSLQTAYKKHGDKLKKWTLCSKNSLTNEEKRWFDDVSNLKHKGTIVLPVGNKIIIDHWGDSIILNLLRKYPSIYKFFTSFFAPFY